MRRQFPFRLYLALLVAAVGCEGPERPAGLPDLHPVTIEVIQDGQPLPEASIALYAEGSKWAVGGSTDNNGKAVIRTLGKFDGAPVGTYKVCIWKELVEQSGKPSNDPSAPPVTSKCYDLVDLQYKSDETTPLEITVVAGKNTPDPIDVGKATKELVPDLAPEPSPGTM